MRGALILCLAALVGSPSADHWAYRYVEYAADLEVLQAYDATHYRPDTVLTRAQMAVYVARAFELAL